jgi:hypothetical protein
MGSLCKDSGDGNADASHIPGGANLFAPTFKNGRHRAEPQQTQLDDPLSSYLFTNCYAYQNR